MRINVAWAGTLMSVAASALVLSAAGQQPDAAGPFTGEQAAAGGPLFQRNCASCHASDLSGGAMAPALAGPAFANGWNTRTTRDLVDAIRTMPPTTPGVLGDEAHVNIAAYILRLNGVAFGPRPLTVAATDSIDAALTSPSNPYDDPESPFTTPTCGTGDGGLREAAATRAELESKSEWPLYGGSATNQRYSTLAQITASNVTSLGGAWTTRLPGPTNQTSVTMSNGRIFVPTLHCNVAALDAKTGQIVWVFELTTPPARRGLVGRRRSRRRVCGGRHGNDDRHRCGDRGTRVDAVARPGFRQRKTVENHRGAELCRRCGARAALGWR